MSNIFDKMNDFAASYYDDIIVYSKKEDHEECLHKVFDALYKAGLKLNKTKCKFFVDSVHFLEFKISKNSVHPSEKKTEVINNYPVPKSKKDVKKFLGLPGFYRKLVANYSLIAALLTRLQCKEQHFNVIMTVR